MTQAQPAAPSPSTGLPLIDRFVASGAPLLGEGDLDAFIAGEGLRVIFVTGDPVKLLDAADIAVILPELCRHFAPRLAPAVAARALEPRLASAYGIDVRPALGFFAGGQHLGTITRVRDWDEYLARISAFLDAAGPAAATTRQ